MSFPTYPSYQDSGVEWLGEVPSDWAPTRLRFLVHLNPSKTEVGNLDPDTEVSFVPMEAVGEQGELSLDHTRPIGQVLTGYTYFSEGDVSIAKITPCFENGKGAIMRGLTGGVGFGTTELIVARARPDETTPEFLDWLFRSPAFRSRGEAAMYGAGGQKRVPDNFVRDFISPGAPLEEQIGIAAFLDRETAKIDALIEEQRRLIALLKEKRQAVISHAVTKGLDPNAPMKDSGIEWLGEVPAHWRVVPLKFLASVQTGLAKGKDHGDAVTVRVPYLRVANVQNGYLNLEDVAEIEVLPADIDRYRLRVGDVLMNEGGDFDKLGRGDVWRGQISDCLHQNHVFAVRPTKVASSWLNIVNGSDYAQRFFMLRSKQTTNLASISSSNLMELPVVLPPVDEQAKIEEVVQSARTELDALTGEAQRAIDLLTERRAALISAAVTGKIDVRETAKVLPFPIDRARARGLVATEIIERCASQPTFGRVKFQKVAFLAEGYVGISELAGCYLREAAGPLDRALIEEMENGAHSIAGVERDQPGGPGTTVSYRLGQPRGAHRQELADWLGEDRTAKLDKLITDFADLTTKGAEAVATLYGVWNDALIDGQSPSDDEIIAGFLNDWHPEKQEKFRAAELPAWLDWMRRHAIVPTGSGPKTTTGRLFV